MQRPTRKSGACNRFYRYGKAALAIKGQSLSTIFYFDWLIFKLMFLSSFNHPVPPVTDKNGWKKRNRKVARLWMELTDDEKLIFKDPYFWALAGLPDPDGWVVDDDDDWEDEEDDPPAQDLNNTADGVEPENLDEEETPAQVTKQAATILAPKVHQLSAEDEAKLRPLFDEMVDKVRIELNHGKPARGPGVGSTVTKGLAAFKQAHANVSSTVLFLFESGMCSN